jgi:hypothetical protein
MLSGALALRSSNSTESRIENQGGQSTEERDAGQGSSAFKQDVIETMSNSRRRKTPGHMSNNKGNPDMSEDYEARLRFLQRPDVRQFAERRRLLRPSLLKFLASIGVKPMIDEATGEIVVSADAFAARLETVRKAGSSSGWV